MTPDINPYEVVVKYHEWQEAERNLALAMLFADEPSAETALRDAAKARYEALKEAS